MKAKSNSEIINFLNPYASEMGLEIVAVEFKMSKSPSLTIFVDKLEGGIDLDTLEKFHNLINEPLDGFDPYPNPYTLNVSSPGLDRAFTTERDFIRNMNKMVEVKLYAPMKGVKSFEAQLVGYDGNNVTLLYKGNNMVIELNKIAKINQAIIFD